MPDCSPTKWHRAHTTWFFETFVLSTLDDHEPFDPAYAYLFNSYYEAVGPRHPRPRARADHPAHVSTRSAATGRTSTRRCDGCSTTDALRRDRRRPRRARPAPRAAAPGAAAHGRQAPAVPEPAATGLRRPGHPATAAGRSDDPAGWRTHTGGDVEVGHDGDRLRLRQRGPRHSRAPRAVRARRPAGHLRRVARRSSPTAATGDPSCGCPTDGHACSARAWTAPLYWDIDATPCDRVHPRRHAPTLDPHEPVMPRELLRGRRLRPMGRRPAAHRVRVGGRRSATPPVPATRGASLHPSADSVGHDPTRRVYSATAGSGPPARTCPYPGFRRRRGRGRRVQREVHGQPARPARQRLRHPDRATRGRPTATSSPRPRDGRSPAFAWPPMADHDQLVIDVHLDPDDWATELAERDPQRPPARAPDHPSGVVLRRPGFAALRRDHPARRVLPDPGRAGDHRGDRR